MRIPLPPENLLAIDATRAVRLDRERRPRVDLSGVIQGIGDNAGLAAQAADIRLPRVPVGLNDPVFDGLGEIGAAFRRSGDIIAHLAEEKGRADAYRMANDIDLAFSQLHGDFEQWKAGHSAQPDAWAPEWNQRMEKFESGIRSDGNFSPAALEQIQATTFRRAALAGIGVAQDAATASFRLARESGEARFQEAIGSGDYKLATSLAVDLISRDLWSPAQAAGHLLQGRGQIQARTRGELDALRQQGREAGDRQGTLGAWATHGPAAGYSEDEIARGRRDDEAYFDRQDLLSQVEADITGNPRQAAQRLRSSEGWPGLPEADRLRYQRQAEAAFHGSRPQAVREMRALLQRGVGGKPLDPALVVGDERFTRFDVDVLRDQRPLDDPGEYSSLRTMILTRDLDEGEAGETTANLRIFIDHRFSEERAARLHAALDKRLASEGDPEATRRRLITEPLFKQIDDAFFHGLLGTLEAPDGTPDARGIRAASGLAESLRTVVEHLTDSGTPLPELRRTYEDMVTPHLKAAARQLFGAAADRAAPPPPAWRSPFLNPPSAPAPAPASGK